jgi:hypothetical protein
MNEKETEMLELFVDNDNSMPFETRVKKIVDRYFRGCGITSDESYINVIRDGCRKLSCKQEDEEDITHRLKIWFYNIPDYIKLHKRSDVYHIRYPAFETTMRVPPEYIRNNLMVDSEKETIENMVIFIQKKVLSEAIKFFIALNKDKTKFVIEDSVPDGVLIGNRDSYINYMKNIKIAETLLGSR